ncbi:MAG: sigma-70 family RNA polymerase sigma factor [Acidobacteriota bacterium]|nr:MAG: sigma-70 family RNA polymerase sigma factor [Acidobacteriota bacterium]
MEQTHSTGIGAKAGGWGETEQDLMLIEASRRGDQLAFNRLVLKWEQRVFNLVLRMIGDREEAADTTQEIFLAVYRSIGRFRGDARFSTWIYRIAVNHCLTRLRRRPMMIESFDSKDSETGFGVEFSRKGDQEQQVLQGEQRRSILRSVAALPPKHRAVVELKLFQEETFESIATVLEEPLSTVKSRFYAGLDVLKERLHFLAEESL